MVSIPDKTQVHVDRLIGSKVGDLTVLESLGEGRFGTRYRAVRTGGAPITLEVLRLGLQEREHEVRAVDAVGCKQVPATSEFGTLRDGRRYRVLAAFDGESLEQRVQRLGPLPPPDIVKVLTGIAEALQAPHAWAQFHGNLEASTVVVAPDGAVHLLDFGLWKTTPSAETDLIALGALGWYLFRGEAAVVTPAPASLARLLSDLEVGAITDMAAAHQALSTLQLYPTAPSSANLPIVPSRPAGPSRRGELLAGLLLLVIGGLIGLGWLLLRPEADTESEDVAVLEGAEAAPPEPTALQPVAEDPNANTTDSPRRSVGKKSAGVPTAEALQAIMSRFERKLRAQMKPGDDLDQALAVLNQQRLRLTGSPTVEDRKDVAKKLVGWRLSYLRGSKP